MIDINKDCYKWLRNYYNDKWLFLGDIIQDWRGTLIKVDKMQIITSSFTNEYPEYIYEGLKVTKKGILFKDGTSDDIYQSRLVKINGVEVKNENI